MRIEGLKSLRNKLSQLKRDAQAEERRAVVQVGYTQSYAIYVHENLEAHHPVGTAKFLEMPARKYRAEIGRIIAAAYSKTKSMVKALLLGGLRLQRESQELVPVDTSALKASAYTALEEDAPQVIADTQAKSETLRQSVLSERRRASYEKLKVRAAYLS